MCQGNIFNRLHAIVLISIVSIAIVMCFVNEVKTHPLKNTATTKNHNRDKRDIDILAECDTECLPEEEIKEYDLLLYYEYEEVTEFPFLYSYIDPSKEKKKSCMYRCMILQLNNSVETTTIKEEKISLRSTTSRLEINTIPSTAKENDANVTSGIGLRFNIHSVKPDILNKIDSSTLTPPIRESSTTTTKPIVLIPKKLILTVIEAEMMEVGEKPPTLTTTSSIKLKETQTSLPNKTGEISSRTSIVKNKTNTESKTERNVEKGNQTTLKPVDEHLLKTSNISDIIPLNNIVVKVPKNSKNGSTSEILVNDSEVKCKIYLINENSPGETSTKKSELNLKNTTKKETTIEATATTTKAAQITKPVTLNVGISSPYKITTNLNLGTTEAIENIKKKNNTLMHGKRENIGSELAGVTDKAVSISYRSGNSSKGQNISNQNDTIFSTTPELQHEKNETETNLSSDITTELPAKEELEKNILNLNIDNYSFHGNFTAANKSNIPERLQKALVENLRKMDNSSTVIVSPQTKRTKSVTKLGKVSTSKPNN